MSWAQLLLWSVLLSFASWASILFGIGQRGLCCLRSLDSLLGTEMKITRMKAWIWVCSSQPCGFWRSGLQCMNKIVSCRDYVAVLLLFIVLLSVTACRRKRFLWPMANKVNITWQVNLVKRSQMLFIWRFKVKSWLASCRPFIANELAAEITQQNEMLSFHIKWRSKLFNDAIGNKVIDMTTKNN